MAITVLKNNVPWGPFTRAQIQDGLERGDFTLQYLAHGPGLREWLPLSAVLEHVDRSAELPPVPSSEPTTPAPLTKVETAAMPPLPKGVAPAPITAKYSPGPPPLMPPTKAAPQKISAPAVAMKPASFFARLVAFVIDCLVLYVPVFFLFGLGAMTVAISGTVEHADHETLHEEWALLWRNFRELLILVTVGGAWLYAASLECSRWQGTVGKQWMRMKVTDAEGQRLSFFRATGRHVAKLLSGLPFFLGFIIALFSSRGLALHDRLAETRVIKK